MSASWLPHYASKLDEVYMESLCNQARPRTPRSIIMPQAGFWLKCLPGLRLQLL